MNGNTRVAPQLGFYLVTTVDSWGIQTHQVGKDKCCTCGGSAKHPCRHIKAVTSYLKAGGERAHRRTASNHGKPDFSGFAGEKRCQLHVLQGLPNPFKLLETIGQPELSFPLLHHVSLGVNTKLARDVDDPRVFVTRRAVS